ncbi:MAG: hypothetical protein LQ342_000093 [Letrouitia transgressa]|nr:MAG: hypothetical protein LQ342_000093 [Letrouitia transgressa]
MPPKKVQAESRKAKEATTTDGPKSTLDVADEEAQSQTNDASSNVPLKRKAPESNEPSPKAPRRSARGAQTTATDPIHIAKFLLSPSSLDLCRPKDEIEDIKNRGFQLRTYASSTFSPFEELACAIILSRPISHALGLRSIRTIFNDPYSFATPRKIREAGYEGVRKALDEARTQHRQKTAEELLILANAVVDTLGDGDEEDVTLEKVRKDSAHELEKEKEILRKSIKGLGKTGLEIFARRIQAQWPEVYPYADTRTLSALNKIGLPNKVESLAKMLDENWGQLGVKDVEGDIDTQKRKALARVLERAVELDLEGNGDAARVEASSLGSS